MVLWTMNLKTKKKIYKKEQRFLGLTLCIRAKIFWHFIQFWEPFVIGRVFYYIISINQSWICSDYHIISIDQCEFVPTAPPICHRELLGAERRRGRAALPAVLAAVGAGRQRHGAAGRQSAGGGQATLCHATPTILRNQQNHRLICWSRSIRLD